jgi:malate permease and related proteins
MNGVLEVAYNVILPILLTMALGAALGRYADPEPRTLATATLYLFGPCLVISGISQSELAAGEIGQVAFIVVAFTFIMTVFAWAASFRMERRTHSAFLLSVALINAGNFGLPFAEFAFGEAGREVSVIVYVVTSVMSNTLGVFLASRGSYPIQQALVNVFKVPLPYAVLIAFTLNFGDIALPIPVARCVEILSEATVPSMLVLVGLQLSRLSVREGGRERQQAVILSVAMRLLLSPLIVLLIALVMGVSGIKRDVILLQLSMPTAVASLALATEYGSDYQFITSSILVSTIVSILTLSIILGAIL